MPGAIVMRAVLTCAGAIQPARFHRTRHAFGALLRLSGAARLWMAGKERQSIEHNAMLRWLQGHVRRVHASCSERFFNVQGGVR